MITVSLPLLPEWLRSLTTWRAGLGAQKKLRFAFMWPLTSLAGYRREAWGVKEDG